MKRTKQWENIFIFFLLQVLGLILLSSSAFAATIIDGIPKYHQRATIHIPLDVNYRDVTISATEQSLQYYEEHERGPYDREYQDCGVCCLSMVEAYFAGYGSNDEWVYFKICYAITPNPVPAWSDVLPGGDLWFDSDITHLSSGYNLQHSMSTRDILNQLKNGNPVLVHRNIKDNEHWVVIYGYDGDENNIDWTRFKIKSPTIHDGVQDLYLNNFVSSYPGPINDYMYRTSGILPNAEPLLPKDMSLAKQTYIFPSENLNVVLAVNPENGKVQLANKANLANQLWSFEKVSDDKWRIVSLYNGGVLDVPGGSTEDGTDVQVWKRNNQYNQEWGVYETTGGYSIVPSYAKNKRLDVYSGDLSAGQRLTIYTSNNSKAQIFSFYHVNNAILPKSMNIDASELELSPRKTGQLSVTFTPGNVDSNKKAVTWTSSNPSVATVSESGIVTAVSAGTVTITATSVFNPTIKASRDVSVGNTGNIWLKRTIPDGNYAIVSALNNSYFIDIAGSSFPGANGTNIQLWGPSDEVAACHPRISGALRTLTAITSFHR